MDSTMKAIDHLFDKRLSLQKELYLLELKFGTKPSSVAEEKIKKVAHQIEELDSLIHHPSNWNGP